MRFTYVFLIPVILSAALMIAGCSSGKEQKSSASTGKFMQNEQPSKQSGSSSKGYFARERERRLEYEREFKDVRRPINQDHFRVIPWHGKHYEPRSEQVHESSREPDSSLFRF